MKSIKSLLVPVDHSEISVASYHYALRLAEKLSASVHLLHCIPAVGAVAGHGHMVFDLTVKLQQEAEARLQEFMEAGLEKLRPELEQLPEVKCSTSDYGLGEGIIYYAEANDVDLIVAGTHGVSDGWDRLFGTNAAFLAGKVKLPILVLPSETEFRPLSKICFATDLRDGDRDWAVRLNDALKVFNPSMDFLHVEDPEKAQSAGALDLFKRAFERPRNGMEATFTTVFDPDVTDGLFAHLQEQPHDLLVMVKPRRSWWDRLFVHSETKESAGITTLPLLIIGEGNLEK
jgi:nucleotide-binding universal stress UspA family protein